MKYPQDFWNERYSSTEYIYGTHPNEFLAEKLPTLPTKGRILFPAEGEGRNAVFAAKIGWEVFAFDMSEEGRKKALTLAQHQGANLTYDLSKAEDVDYPTESFDCIALIYANFPPETREGIHRNFIKYLRPGGYLLFESFSKDQLGYQKKYDSGGPKDINMLFSEDEIREEFSGIQIHSLQTIEAELSEGNYHKGKASIIRCVGVKAL